MTSEKKEGKSSYHIPSLIEKKRDGGELSEEELSHIISSYTSGELADYQMSALAMAIFYSGMSTQETACLTREMLGSGATLNYREDSPPKVDKHSTGGIGDKVSLILAPLLACDNLWVPMISGRGLGITGGTLDKLEAIPGYRTDLSEQEILSQLDSVGAVITGQTSDICPADRKLYALRDVTATVASQPLIVASIMSKKLAENLDRLVLDVKYGSAAFMKTKEEAQELASAMTEVGKNCGVETSTLLSPMDQPLGASAGNALEVIECVETLQGGGPTSLRELTLDLAEKIADSDRATLAARLDDGSAWEKFCEMVKAQGGSADDLENLAEIQRAPFCAEIKSPASGTIQHVDAQLIGQAILEMGGGRAQAGDSIDHRVGIDQILPSDSEVRVGDSLMRIHSSSKEQLGEIAERIHSAVQIA